mgnify:CR=1 FL=1
MAYRYLALPIASLMLIAACSSSTTTTETKTDPTNPKDGGGVSTEASTNEGGSTGKNDAGEDPDGPDDPSSECSSAANQQACVECCATPSASGAMTYQKAILDCLCTAAVCQTECSQSACKATPANPDAACTTCLNAKLATSCSTAVQTACSADPSCVTYATCLQKSGCASKK